jgi:transcriptional antiterminator Rof (Rho-off)
MSDYRPIPCEHHSEYELAIMRGEWLLIDGVSSRGGERGLRCLPLDMVAREGEEYLQVRTESGEPLEFRLDRIEGAVKAGP